MKKLAVAGLLAALFLGQAQAQDQALVVATCGTLPITYTAGQIRMPTVDTTGKLCLNASGGAAPTGPAGGSLKGTYPNPGLADINSIASSLTIGGGAIGPNALAVTGQSALGNLSLGAAKSAAAWTTGGVRIVANAVSYTDTSSSGTVATAYSDIYGATTILASSATTYTQYYGAFFKAPVASTNVTMTNKSALGADTISIGGAAQSTFALAVTGTVMASGNIASSGGDVTGQGVYFTAAKNMSLLPSGTDAWLSSNGGSLKLVLNAASSFLSTPAANILQLGASDAAVAVAQGLRVQSVVAGTAAANGANWTLIGSLPTGTGTSGDIIFQTGVKTGSGTTQGTATTALTIKGETQSVVFGGANASSAGSWAFSSGGNFVLRAAAGSFASLGITGLGDLIKLTANGSALLGVPSLATNATDGFIYAASGAGTPTGTPVTQTGLVPIYIDTTNSQLWLYLGGAWKQPKTPAGAAIVTWQ